MKPSVVVTADGLVRAGIRAPEFYAGDLLCPVGKTPQYVGQPVALLVFEDFDNSIRRGWRCGTQVFSNSPRKPAPS